MPYEIGGRADKSGNRYEIRCVVYQMLRILEEKIYSVTLEALGDDEQGIDLWIDHLNGDREGQQCKGRNGSRESWTISSMKAHDIFINWKMQLDRNRNNKVALVSPLSCSLIIDLIDRANNTDGDYEHFYNNQIGESSKQFQKFYKDYAEAMGLNIKDKKDIMKSIDYLNRTFYRQQPDFQLREIILDKIRFLLVGDEYKIYDTFVSIVVDEDILGKQITNTILCELLKRKDIKMKNLALDKRIIPRVKEINDEYRKFFTPIKDELIERKEFALCKSAIDLGESIIVHGKAGNGKSGCTEAIMNYCEKNLIPIIAIKLDKRIPSGNAEKWGQDLGLPASIVHCLHSISKDEKAVIILDQLDALRWTQAHSRDSLLVCTEVINEVIKINAERKKKISVVFVCRTYDLENDNNIKALFKFDDNTDLKLRCQKIHVEELDDDTVKQVVGEKYNSLSNKLKIILKTPSNLYIWTKLDPNKEYDEFSTTSHLISEWWSQLQSKCKDDVDERDIVHVKKKLVQRLDRIGRINISKKTLGDVNENALFYLSSNGFLLVKSDNVSFTHQSILDYFLAEVMINKYYDGEQIVNIIGNKEKQTPSRRYQVQMLLQNLVEIDSRDFISVGEQILVSENIRYYIKHVFYEVLGQVSNIDEPIKRFVLIHCEDEKNFKYIVDNVLIGHSNFIRLLRDNGILDKWININDKKDIVFNLLSSISSSFNIDDINFIQKYIFKSEEDDKKLEKCFYNDISYDTDEMFDLRIKMYEQYPYMAEKWMDYKKMFKECEIRTIKFLELLLKQRIRNRERDVYRYEEELLDATSDVIVEKGKEVLSILLPHVPYELDESIIFSKWSDKYGYKYNLERTCIEIIKKANRAIILDNPNDFFDIYAEYMGKGFPLFNEIILSSLSNLPEKYSDIIINYLCEDFSKNIFDETSENKNQLLLVEEIIKKHSASCSNESFSLLENKIIHYISPKAKEWYSRRIEYNKSNNGNKLYWSFWGDLQVELLPCLPYKRMSEEGKRLLLVLKRRFKNETNIYVNSRGHSGSVSSPISGKKLSNKNWFDLLTNKKMEGRENHSWRECEGGFIESSIEQFASDFRVAVGQDPINMINLVFRCGSKIPDKYIDSLFSGVVSSEKLKEVPSNLLEEMIIKYNPSNNEGWRARDICGIVERRGEKSWSQRILDIIKNIAMNHSNPEMERPIVTNNDDKEMITFDMLEINALNCVRGSAASTIANLLWDNDKLYYQFKDTIDKLTQDENLAVRLASMSVLWPIYNIDREWAAEKILNLYEHDYRLAGYRDSKNMFFLLYAKQRERVLEVIKKCFYSQDERLVKMGAYSLAEMYIVKNEFSDEMYNIEEYTENQAKSILEMACIYFNKGQYNDIAKDIIIRFKLSELDLEFPISRLFYEKLINLERDKEFLLEIMKSNISRRTIHAFASYLEENSKSLVDYKDIILSMSYNLINYELKDTNGYWGIEDEISKLIVGLYDETTILSNVELNEVAQSCLDIWDLMFKKQIGSIRVLSQKILER